MEKLIVAANWKLNKNPAETKLYFSEFLKLISKEDEQQFVFFPPAINLHVTAEALADSDINWGAQSVYAKDQGAFTGENSAQTLAEIGGSHVLIGHSERRQIFKQTDEDFAAQLKTVQDHDLVPMLCIGETLEQRESESTQDVLRHQLTVGLSQADWSKSIIIAYEPVWAIGTGKVATPELAEETHKFVKLVLKGMTEDEVPVLYGGSVKPENAGELGSQDSIDGFLVGGASLKPEVFAKITP